MEGDIPSQGEEVSTSTNAPSLLQDRNSADIPSASENKTSNPGVETISPNASTLLNLDSSLGHEAQVEPIHERPNGENIAPLKGWPISPMPFRKSWTATILEHCTYLLMGICSAMFLVFAILAASVHSTYPGTNIKYYANGPPLSPPFEGIGTSLAWNFSGAYDGPTYGSMNLSLLQAAKLTPIILPILFAGIVGNVLRLFARWKGENGINIGNLETLIRSRSLASTATTLFSLRTVGRLEIGLLVLWIMSPLAGQASLRILSTKPFTYCCIDVSWLTSDVGPPSPYLPDDLQYINDSRFIPSIADPYFQAMAYQYGQDNDEGIDMYKMPLLPRTALNETWQAAEMPQNSEIWSNESCKGPTDYTSFVGLDIEGPYQPSNGSCCDIPITLSNATFSATVGLYEFQCPSASVHLTASSWERLLPSITVNLSSPELLKQGELGSGFFVGINLSTNSTPAKVFFGSFFNTQLTLWSCFVYLNSRNVTVNSTASDDPYSKPYEYSIYKMGVSSLSIDTPLTDLNLSTPLLGVWPTIDAASPGRSSIAEQFLFYGPDSEVGENKFSGLVDLSTVDNITFSKRFTTLFNTYYGVGPIRMATLRSTSATPLTTNPFTLIICNWVYFTIVVIVSIFLLLCVGLGAWLNHKLSTPDILGYVSSLTIENPHFSVPGNPGTFLDGMDRAKALRKMKVQIRDVQQGEVVGKFAFTNVIVPVRDTKRKKDRKFV